MGPRAERPQRPRVARGAGPAAPLTGRPSAPAHGYRLPKNAGSEPLLSDASAPEPAEIAGRYRVISTLGSGAFGTVYEALDRESGRRVAVKTIRLGGLGTPERAEETRRRFHREARLVARLRHPNIVAVCDVGQEGPLSYLAMELVEGDGLDGLIHGDGRFGQERAARIGAQVAEALAYAHARGVVHRDVKPGNILVESGDRVRVADFGIAKARDTDSVALTGMLIGTPAYMSPEQARGRELVGRSDLFSLGCVLYEMLTGRRAFAGDSITGLIFRIITEAPRPMREIAPDLAPELVRIVDRALRKEPEARHASGQQLAEELRSFADAFATTAGQ